MTSVPNKVTTYHQILLDDIDPSLDQKQISKDQIFPIMIQVIDRLKTLHQAGFVHGDLSPSSIHINQDASMVTLTDFGLSVVLRDSLPDIEEDQNHEGKLAFASRQRL